MLHVILAVLMLISSVVQARDFGDRALQQSSISQDWKFYPTYMFQQQEMRNVSWLYVGFAPRMEDPDRIVVHISKDSFLLRVSMQMRASDIATYPEYLIRRAEAVENKVNELHLQLLHRAVYVNYLHEIKDMKEKWSQLTDFVDKYNFGLAFLQAHFKTNIFPVPNTNSIGAVSNETVVIAHFVYPLTVFKFNSSWPIDADYVQSKHFSSARSAIEERKSRRTFKDPVDLDGDGIKESEVEKVDYIFSGFPAFWLDSGGAGTGVHGPIRFSRKDQRGLWQGGPYGKKPEEMLKFWQENQFALALDGVQSLSDLEIYNFRWDLVRKHDSHGCMRAEPMELRHLLPSDPEVIFKKIHWIISTENDKIQLPGETESKLVDVNYYTVDPFQVPPTRADWVRDYILTDSQKKSPDAQAIIDNFINHSVQFDYLNPVESVIEIISPDNSDYGNYQIMSYFNRAGGVTEL